MSSVVTPTDMPSGFHPVYDSGFNAYIGSIYKEDAPVGELSATFLFDVKAHHLNGGQTTHGGLLMTLADTALGASVAQVVGHMCSTISLNCDFLSGAQEGERIRINTEVSNKTRTIVFVNGTLEVEGRILMTTSGLWRIINPEKIP